MSDENQLIVPPSFIALFIDPGRSRPNAPREFIAARYDLCEDMANLLDNARRYAGDNATICIDVDGRSLAVCDDGPGVPPDVLERLGERFFRPPGQTQSGAGLGVSIARRIAPLHSGRLTFENREGGGLCVGLHLPG